MSEKIMLNTRLDKTLKDHGSQVLKAHGVSTTEYVRRAFKYLEDYQQLPDCLAGNNEDVYSKRRSMLRTFVGLCDSLPLPSEKSQDVSSLDRHARADEKYARYFS